MIEIHAILTGFVRIKEAQRTRRLGGLPGVILTREWTDWLPILAWLIDHPEGPIVVDTGETARVADEGYLMSSWSRRPDTHPGTVPLSWRPTESTFSSLGIPATIKTISWIRPWMASPVAQAWPEKHYIELSRSQNASRQYISRHTTRALYTV